MCLFTSTKKPYVRPYNDPPPHSSYYSAHPNGIHSTALTLPSESFRDHKHHHRHSRSADRDFVVARPSRSSREIVEYAPRRSSREVVELAPPRGSSRYGSAFGSEESFGRASLPAGYRREVVGHRTVIREPRSELVH